MTTRTRLFDDLSRVAQSAATTLSAVKDEVEAFARQRIERILSDMDLVPREEFEAVKEMAARARGEQEKLEARVAALETALAAKAPKKRSTARKA